MPQVPFNSHIDLNNNEIQNAKFQMLASAPTPTEAKFYYDTTLHKFGYYDGSEWIYGTVYIEGTGIKINGNVIAIDPDVVAQLTDLANYVPTSRTVNGYALSSNIIMIIIGVIAMLPLGNKLIRPYAEKNPTCVLVPCLVIFVFCIIYLADASYNPFLYFRF